MDMENDLYRLFALSFIILCCWLAGCGGEDENLSPEWVDPNQPIKAEPSTVTGPGEIVKLTANATDPDGDTIKYTWEVIYVEDGTDVTFSVLDQGLFSRSTNPHKDFQASKPGRYSVVIQATDGKISISGILPFIDVVDASETSSP